MAEGARTGEGVLGLDVVNGILVGVTVELFVGIRSGQTVWLAHQVDLKRNQLEELQ